MIDLILIWIPLLTLILWLYTSWMSRTFPTLRGKRICLLIAHPDDEAMFFAPSVIALTRPELGNHLKILCLSNGNADGQGKVREKELVVSGMLLGLRNQSDVICLDDPNFPDSMSVTWSPQLLCNLLTRTFAPALASTPTTAAPPATMDTLITFDAHGVSGHPNHSACHAGAAAFLKALMHRHAGWQCPVRLYTLGSVSVARKYAAVVDAPLTLARMVLRSKRVSRDGGAWPSVMLCMSGWGGWRRGQRAMLRAHVSQMRWFRWGWIVLSRYMVINELVLEKVV